VDRYLLFGAFVLLILEITLFLGDLGVLPFTPFEQQFIETEEQKVGQIKKVNQNVRHKSKGSIIWKRSLPSDELYLFDSILTLNNSSAEISLYEDTQIQLDEETLIEISPLKEDQPEHLYLKFLRGTLISHNQSKNLTIQSGKWVLKARPGSEINMRALNKNKMEVEVFNGEVILNKELTKKSNAPSINQTITSGEKLIIGAERVQKQKKVSKDLSWNMKINTHRLYSYQFPVFIEFHWKGAAEKIRFTQSNGEETIFKVSSSQRHISLPLYRGTFLFNLVNQNKISPTLPVNLRLAEEINYISPLPRNRVSLRKVCTFSWTPSQQASKYRLQIAEDEGFNEIVQDISSQGSQVDLKLAKAGLLYWRVFAEDEEGYLVPSNHTRTLYSVDHPLKAPKLQAPKILLPTSTKKPSQIWTDKPLTPKNKRPSDNKQKKSQEKFQFNEGRNNFKLFHQLGASILNFLLPKAHAETEDTAGGQVIFSWYPVPEASHYILEISTVPNFQKLMVSKKLKKEKFIWKNFQKRVYYWRVASAQGNDSSMGLFSQVAEVDLTQTTNMDIPELSPGISYVASKPKQKPEPPQKTVSKKLKLPTQTEALLQLEPSPSLKKVEQEYSFHLFFIPKYFSSRRIDKKEVKTNFKGWSQLTLEAEINKSLKKGNQLVYSMHFTTFNWKPENAPLQKEFSYWSISSSFMHFLTDRNWSYGIAIYRDGFAQKKELASIEWKESWNYGPTTSYIYQFNEQIQSKNGLWLKINKNRLITQITNYIDYQFQKKWGLNFITGLDLTFIGEIFSGKLQNEGFTTGLRLGLKW